MLLLLSSFRLLRYSASTSRAEKLPDLGKILDLPNGWTFSVNTIDQDLTIAPPAPDYTAHSLVDNLKNVCAGCGFDNACSFTPFRGRRGGGRRRAATPARANGTSFGESSLLC